MVSPAVATSSIAQLYTVEQRRRRDASRWTTVQGVLAPLQFLAFLVSLALLGRYLSTGSDWPAAAASVMVKTLFLYTIMITGSLWEHDVFGRYLFAEPFFWEDAVSIAVLALHSIFLAALLLRSMSPQSLAVVALVGYGLYLINAAQFLWKFRRARLAERAA